MESVHAIDHIPPTERPRRSLRRVLWSVHSVLGLVVGAFIVLLSASGSLLVVHHEIEHRFEHDRRVVAAPQSGVPSRPAAELARRVADLAPAGCRLFRLEPASAATEAHKFIFLAADGTTRWSAFVNPHDGRVLWRGPDDALFTSWLLTLHMQLRSGHNGYYVTVPIGFSLVLLSITGVWIYRHRLTALARHPFRISLGWRVALMDLHNWVGVASLYFTFMLGLTGALYAISGLNAKPTLPPTAPFPLTQLAPLEPMLATARERFPQAEILRAQFPARVGASLTLLLVHRDAPVWQKFSRLEFDAVTGALRTVRDAREQSAGDQFRSMLAPLHFGFYGATWLKCAYVIGGLCPGLLAVTGFALWWHRRRGHRPHVSGLRPHAA